MKRIGFLIAVLLCTGVVGVGLKPGLSARAATYGNTDTYEAGDSIGLPWWGNQSELVNQRYGCTSLGPPYEDPPPSLCNQAPYNKGWHQGIDINVPLGTTIVSQVDGVIAKVETNNGCGLGAGCGLGYLAIKEANGNIIYLLHGLPTSAYSTVGTLVSIGAQIYTTGSNGNVTGPHLHFEVHTSVIGELSTAPNAGPGDDINPEAWLSASGCPTADPATATPASSGAVNESGYFNWYARDTFLWNTDNIHMSNPGASAAQGMINLPNASGQPYYLVPGAASYSSYPVGTSGGPVQIAATSGPSVLASQRVNYESSHDEVNAPTNASNAAGTTLYFPYYGKVGCYWEDNIHLLNPSATSASGSISIPGYSAIAFTLGAGQEGYYGFPPGTVGGPVKISVNSGGPAIYASQRVTYYRSFDEVNALNAAQADYTLFLMWYGINSDYNSDWIHVVNPGLSASTVTVTLGSNSQSHTIAAGGEWHMEFAAGLGGPVEIQATSPVLASQRVQYRDSFSEVDAVSPTLGATTLHFNWYGYDPSSEWTADNIHLVNPNGAAALGTISLPGQSTYSFYIPPNSFTYYGFPAGAIGGPVTVQVTNGIGVLASQRVQYFNSFHEVNALEFG